MGIMSEGEFNQKEIDFLRLKLKTINSFINELAKNIMT